MSFYPVPKKNEVIKQINQHENSALNNLIHYFQKNREIKNIKQNKFLCFQILHIDHFVDDKKNFYVRLYGCTEDEYHVICEVQNFYPFFT